MVSNNASLSPAQIASARIHSSQPLFFQLYKRKDDADAAKSVREIEALGYNAIFLTVDAPVAGSRERDIRAPFILAEQERKAESELRKREGGMLEAPQTVAAESEGAIELNPLGTAGALLSTTDADLSWEKVRLE